MGTVSEKLTYLNTTKQKIKQGINNLGGSITDNTTFRNYATELDGVYNKLPKVSDTGTDLNLSPTIEARLGLIPRGNTYQQTYSGKNLFENKLATRTTAGITYTPVYENGLLQYINLNGTATSNSIVTLGKIDLKGGTAYTSSDDAVGSPTTFFMYLFNSSNIDVAYVWENEKTYTPPADDTFTVYFQVKNGVTLNNLKIKPMIRLASVTDNTYEPYTGGQPSPNPDYPQMPKVVTGENEVKAENKNLFNINENPITAKTFYDNSGNLVSWSNTCGIKSYFEIKSNTTYSIFNNLDNNIKVCFYDEEKTYISQTPNRNSSNNFTTPSNTKYIRFGIGNTESVEWVQLQKGTTATPYVEHKEQNYPLSLGNIELVEIGNYADYIEGTPDNWVKKEKFGKQILNGTETNITIYSSNTNRTVFSCPTTNVNPILATKPENMLSSHFIPVLQSATWKNGDVGVRAGQNELYYTLGAGETVDSFKNWLANNNVVTYYLLATPTDVPITDTTLISQLNALYYARSYDDETNISTSCEDGNMPMKINASALKGI